MKIDFTKVKEGFTTMDLLKEENKELKQEIERLNNIFNKLNNWLSEQQLNSVDLDELTIIQVRDKILYLKGDV